MTYRTGMLFASIALSTALLSTSVRAADFQAELDPASHDNSTRLQVAGEGTIIGSLDGNRLTFRGHFSGLTAPAAKARIGQAMVPGVPATTFFADLTIGSGTSGDISGAVTLSPSQRATLTGKALFIQIDSTSPSPNGTLWGWFLPATARRAR